MPNFDKARGVAAMEKERSGGGRSLQYWNYIRWREDKETKYIQFLTPAAELVTVQLHEWIEVGKTKNGKPRYGFFIDRRDPCIGEDYDDLTDRLDVLSKRRTLGAAVELEPKFTKVNNRNKVTGFEVKLESFTKTDENGDEQEVQAPVIGIISQAKANFYGWLGSFAESHEPIEDVPFEIQRTGKDKDTNYVIVPFNNIEVDYTHLFEYINNVSNLSFEEIAAISADGNSDSERAQMIGATYLDKHLEDLADLERYQDQVGPIDYIEDKWGNRANRTASNGARTTYHEPEPEQLILSPEAVEEAKQEDKIDQLRARFAKK